MINLIIQKNNLNIKKQNKNRMNVQEPKFLKLMCTKSGNTKFTINKFIKKSKRIKTTVNWINKYTIFYTGIDNYIIKNINTNEKTKIQIQMVSPVLSPNKKYILFMITDAQLNLYEMATNNIIKIYYEINENSNKIKYVWSSDSKKIIIILLKNPKGEIYIYDLNNKTTNYLTSLEFGPNRNNHIKIHDDVIIFVDTDEKNNKTVVYDVNMNTKKSLIIKQFDYMQQFTNPEISPDGSKMSIIYDNDSDNFGYLYDLGIITLKNNNLERITKDIKWNKTKWMNNDVLIGLRIYGTYTQLYKIDLSTNDIEQLTYGAVRILNFDILDNRIMYIGRNVFGNIKIKMLNLDNNKTKKIVKLSFLKNTNFGSVREIQWNGTYKNMRGLLIYPINYKNNKKYGLIVDIHGGGSVGNMNLYGSVFRVRIPSEWFIWIQKDVFVFVPEFRSSSIYGSEALLIDDQKNKDIIDGDIKDIESGVDYLISKNLIDDNKMMTIGGSAGAHRANWLPVVSKRYRAIISVDGWNDEKGDMTFKYNPTDYVNKIQTPMLFIMGNPSLGGVDPNYTIKKYYEKLKENNIYTEYMYIDDEGHNFYKPDNIKKIFKKILQWIDKYI